MRISAQVRQTPIIYLALKDAATTDPIGKSSITKIRYTLAKEKRFDKNNFIPVVTDKDISTDYFFNGLQTSDSLCTISGGYNFRWTPDATRTAFFEGPGRHRLDITFTIANRNPAVSTIMFDVV